MAIMPMEAVMYTAVVPEQPNLDAEQSIKDVRNRLAPIVEAVRYFDRVIYMTNRGARVAAVVSIELAELAEEVGGPKALIELVRAVKPEEV
jgi:prevent-host-death family protein